MQKAKPARLVKSNMGEITVAMMSFENNLEGRGSHRQQFHFLSLSISRLVPVCIAELFTTTCRAEKEYAILFRRELLRTICFHQIRANITLKPSREHSDEPNPDSHSKWWHLHAGCPTCHQKFFNEVTEVIRA